VTLPDRLRAAIAATHTSIEQTPLAAAMIGGTISRDEYADWLTSFAHLHAELESALADCPPAAGVYRPADMARTPLLARDRQHFPLDPLDRVPPVAAELADHFGEWKATAPHKLLGALYVLEGSRMGSMALVRPLALAFGLTPQPGVGLDYHLDGIAARPQRWAEFRAVLAAVPLTDDQQADVCEAAVAVMKGLCELYSTADVATATAN
jgi:heme oxygenase